ncbi:MULTISPECIES: NYN domain-containing protein [unclassified Coleofasciculus]|uniref:NYN domain-containing protein n=1 Tax=unclassified Coleofasciculus TaxID=2692782 RepID=UPI001881CC59|nr:MULTISPECIES: NYN domain-containing protein [unclassified Coleofasciculus]MBE9124957.1 NYN domain-containing protein [Coleofasciculus sp. LEGE 07081]MBE9147981.1 NYN domain-containing protein [Coleofasciculus sp. LEGE 07092]
MSDNSSLPLANHSTAIDQISLWVYQTILDIQQQQPELLHEKYRNIQWCNSRYQSAISTKLKAELDKVEDWDAKLLKVRRFLQIFLVPNYFQTPGFGELVAKIHASIPHPSQSTSNGLVDAQLIQPTASPSPVASPPPRIAILLLDAENLQLDIETEKFLAGICTYPIQIKVAFANWRSLGKKDSEFHSRGYELIHVPPGKDSADVKMATVGSSIFVHYPTAREVLVCSSDGVMTHLYNTLQTHGLTVYLVRKQRDTITVLNSKTNQTKTHSLTPLPTIPSLEEFITQLKDIIKAEQTQTVNPWIKLSTISTRFRTQHNITISQVVSTHFPGKKARDIFIDYPNEFVIHQLSDDSELYVTIFQVENPNTTLEDNSAASIESQAPEPPLPHLKSKVELEQALIQIVKTLTVNSSQNYVPISNVGTEFHKQYKQAITKVMKSLNLGSKFLSFLQSCSVLSLQKSGKDYQVTVCTPAKKKTVKSQKTTGKEVDSAQSKIDLEEELEKILIKILAKLTKASGTDAIVVNDLKKEFLSKYQITADASVKNFHADSSLIKFLRSRPTVFSLTLVDKDYRVAIAPGVN